MKIAVTKPELLQILSAHFNQDVTECTITKPIAILAKRIEAALCTKLGLKRVTQTALSGSSKIPAIKIIREVIANNNNNNYPGLAETKWAVENWERWIEFVRQNDRLPNYQGSMWEAPGPILY